MRELAGLRERLVRSAQPREHAGDVLVADRHDYRSAAGRIERRIAGRVARQREPVALADQDDEPRHGRPEPERDPREEHREEHQDHDLERARPVVRQDRAHEHRREPRLRQRQQQQDDAPAVPGVVPALALAVLRRVVLHHAPGLWHHRDALDRRRGHQARVAASIGAQHRGVVDRMGDRIEPVAHGRPSYSGGTM
jgi:hypothetical protein